MQRKISLFVLSIGLLTISTQAQNTSPFWSIAGNSNANSVSKLGTTTADPLNLTTNNATRLRIAADGKVGIGTTSPQQLFHVEGQTLLSIFVSTTAPSAISGSGMIGYMKATPTAAGQRLGYFLTGSRGGAENNYNVAGMAGYAEDAWTSTSRSSYLTFETTPFGATSRSERMRITGFGNVGIGDNSPFNKFVVTDNTTQTATAQIKNLFNSGGYNDGLYITAGNNAGSATNAWYTAFYRPDGTAIGSISQSSATSVAYNTASDKRLKANIRETRFGLADVNKIQVRDYNFIGSKTEQTGFLAQQLYEVFPEAVFKGGDDPKTRPWMVDYGRITPLLVKAMQDLSSENESLKKQVSDMQARMDKLESLISRGTNNTSITSASLEQNTPNPARNGLTTIRYQVPESSSSAKLVLVNAKGQVLKEMSLAGKGAGQTNINTAGLPAGVYSYSLWVDGQQAVSKQLVIAR